jgi:MOSC domain-containing protein YiiM
VNAGVVLSVNLAVPRANRAKDTGVTGIDKRPTTEPVTVRAPGAMGVSGLVGDQIFDVRAHGGDDQAVYAYAREDLDRWSKLLGRELPGGCFGENLTTRDVEVTDAVIGEQWRIGDECVLVATVPRIPCGTFAAWMQDQELVVDGWVKTFTEVAAPGAYMRVVTPGVIRAGDPIQVIHRPEHDITIGMVFRALTLEPELLPRMLEADEVHEEIKEKARRRIAR